MLKEIRALCVSLFTVFKHLFKPAVTIEYPEKRKELPQNFRGKPTVYNCIKCGNCIKVCPTNAINISDNKFQIDLKKCILCGNCAYYCPKKAIAMSKDFELATLNKKDLMLNYSLHNEIEEENNV